MLQSAAVAQPTSVQECYICGRRLEAEGRPEVNSCGGCGRGPRAVIRDLLHALESKDDIAIRSAQAAAYKFLRVALSHIGG